MTVKAFLEVILVALTLTVRTGFQNVFKNARNFAVLVCCEAAIASLNANYLLRVILYRDKSFNK